MNSQSLVTTSPDHRPLPTRPLHLRPNPARQRWRATIWPSTCLFCVTSSGDRARAPSRALRRLWTRSATFPLGKTAGAACGGRPRRRHARECAAGQRACRWPLPWHCSVFSSAALAGRHQLVAIAPPTASVFSAIGLPANTLGVELRDPKATLHEANGQTYLMVEGEIVNLQKTRRKIGELNLFLQDKSGRDIYRWSAAAPVTHSTAARAPRSCRLASCSVRLTTFWCGFRAAWTADMRLSEHG